MNDLYWNMQCNAVLEYAMTFIGQGLSVNPFQLEPGPPILPSEVPPFPPPPGHCR